VSGFVPDAVMTSRPSCSSFYSFFIARVNRSALIEHGLDYLTNLSFYIWAHVLLDGDGGKNGLALSSLHSMLEGQLPIDYAIDHVAFHTASAVFSIFFTLSDPSYTVIFSGAPAVFHFCSFPPCVSSPHSRNSFHISLQPITRPRC
jgi:hypothetical protein